MPGEHWTPTLSPQWAKEHLFWRKYANDCFWNLFKFHQGCPFLITYTSYPNWYICFSFCIIIYSFVCQFFLRYYWYCYNQKLSSGVVLQKKYSYNFPKIHKKTPALKARFLGSGRSTEFNFIEKEIPAQVFSCEFCEISHNTLFKEPFGRLLLYKHPLC